MTPDKEVFDQNLPANIDVWEQMVPQYKVDPGWNQSLDDVDDNFDNLPTEAKSFIRILEKISKKNIEYLSINDSKDEGIIRIRR
jgi:adenylosuccinate synthase